MTQLLQGKTAIVTGGNAGIGKAIALLFAKQGANIALFGTNTERGKKAVDEIAAAVQNGVKLQFFQVDVSKTKAVDQTIEEVLQNFGSIDILVNNAGIVRDMLLMKMTEEDWDVVIDVNLKSVYNMTHALVRPFLKAKKGKIINVSSVVGLMGNAGQTNYAASKAGMIGFTKSLAKEVAGRGITVNCIAPGFIDTQMTESLTESQKATILGQIPMSRLGTSEEIAKAALFLASDMSDYITGQVLTVDGGMVM
ncbi:MAG: 3-oxoacyl-ACP reductase FabG [Chlamydiales bacterium]|nr:3-oxoacyl-ACP reductase FabG [Chlamydiales bacterium]